MKKLIVSKAKLIQSLYLSILLVVPTLFLIEIVDPFNKGYYALVALFIGPFIYGLILLMLSYFAFKYRLILVGRLYSGLKEKELSPLKANLAGCAHLFLGILITIGSGLLLVGMESTQPETVTSLPIVFSGSPDCESIELDSDELVIDVCERDGDVIRVEIDLFDDSVDRIMYIVEKDGSVSSLVKCARGLSHYWHSGTCT